MNSAPVRSILCSLSVGAGASANAAVGGEGPAAGLPTAPIKYRFANISPRFMSSGSGDMSFLVINQRSDYAFGLFSGGKDYWSFRVREGDLI
ncbi:unnamed protein product [Urochloa humidicola]